MKPRCFFGSLLLGLCLVVGCVSESTRKGSVAAPRLGALANSASVLIEFRAWSSMSVVRPTQLEGQFQVVFDKARIREFFMSHAGSLDTVVVVVTTVNFSESALSAIKAQWEPLLRAVGCKRFVFGVAERYQAPPANAHILGDVAL